MFAPFQQILYTCHAFYAPSASMKFNLARDVVEIERSGVLPLSTTIDHKIFQKCGSNSSCAEGNIFFPFVCIPSWSK